MWLKEIQEELLARVNIVCHNHVKAVKDYIVPNPHPIVFVMNWPLKQISRVLLPKTKSSWGDLATQVDNMYKSMVHSNEESGDCVKSPEHPVAQSGLGWVCCTGVGKLLSPRCKPRYLLPGNDPGAKRPHRSPILPPSIFHPTARATLLMPLLCSTCSNGSPLLLEGKPKSTRA